MDDEAMLDLVPKRVFDKLCLRRLFRPRDGVVVEEFDATHPYELVGDINELDHKTRENVRRVLALLDEFVEEVSDFFASEFLEELKRRRENGGRISQEMEWFIRGNEIHRPQFQVSVGEERERILDELELGGQTI